MGLVDHSAPRPTPSEQELELAAQTIKLLSDKTRLAILLMVHTEELPVSAIAARLDRALPAVSQHLSKLKAARLVTSRREGTTVMYSQPDQHVNELVNNALDFAEHALHSLPPHHTR